jgi:hypothetical protein
MGHFINDTPRVPLIITNKNQNYQLKALCVTMRVVFGGKQRSEIKITKTLCSMSRLREIDLMQLVDRTLSCQ